MHERAVDTPTSGLTVDELAERTRAFVLDVVIDAELALGERQVEDSLRAELQAAARPAGVFAPHATPEYGGLGLNMLERSAVFEEAGYSPLGPVALNCAAPDEGNMHLLDVVATPEQRDRYLRPLVAGEVRSAFAMTEPAPGAGSDPAMLRTAADRVDGGWVINGHKWFITGAAGAAFVMCMARTSTTSDSRGGATIFLVDADNPGFVVERAQPTIDRSMVGGHSEIRFVDCFVPDDAVLGEVDAGFVHAQVRLAPARLTHCMRWLGLARRSLDIALDRIAEREAFGARIEDLGIAQHLVADSVIDIEASRALIREACRALDAGARGAHESSVAKVFVAEAVNRVVDRAIQLSGGLGVTNDVPLARFAAEVRGFRIYDGPSEVHRWATARRASRRRAQQREAGAGAR